MRISSEKPNHKFPIQPGEPKKFPKSSKPSEPPVFRPRPPHRPLPDETWGEKIERNRGGRSLPDETWGEKIERNRGGHSLPSETWGEKIERNTGRPLNDRVQVSSEARDEARDEDFANPFAAWEA